MATSEFSVVREISRRELESHQKRFTGITISAPAFITQDDNGLLEWVCDVRIGVVEGWAIVKNCLVAQWAIGVVTDAEIPVLCERSEAGRVTIIGRSEVVLPQIALDIYEYEELDFFFMRNLDLEADGSIVDGFGFEMKPPGTIEIAADLKDNDIDDDEDANPVNDQKPFGKGLKNGMIPFVNELIPWDDPEWIWGEPFWGKRRAGWQNLPPVKVKK